MQILLPLIKLAYSIKPKAEYFDVIRIKILYIFHCEDTVKTKKMLIISSMLCTSSCSAWVFIFTWDFLIIHFFPHDPFAHVGHVVNTVHLHSSTYDKIIHDVLKYNTCFCLVFLFV